MKLESDIRSGIIDNLKQYKKRPGTLMKELIKETVRVISDYPIIAIFQDQAQMQQLILRVPPEKMENNFSGDMLAVNELFNGTDILTKRSAEDITAFIWAIVYMTLNRDSYNGYFNNVIDLISDMTEKYFKREE